MSTPSFDLTDVQREFRATLRAFCEERVAPQAAEVDRTAEFPSSAQAQAFFDSPDYQAVRALREGAGEGVFLLLEGYPGDEWRTVLAASQALGPPGNSR